MPKFREGDVVTIEATVASTSFNMDDGAAKIKIKFPPYHDAYVDPAQLTMKRPKIVVGDRIAWGTPSADYTGTVLAIADDHVWVDRGDGEYGTVWLPIATRLDPEPATEPVAAQPPPPESLQPTEPTTDPETSL